MHFSSAVFSLLSSAAVLARYVTAAPLDNCNVLTSEQQNLIGLNACNPVQVTIQSVPESVVSFLDNTPYQVGQQDFITP
ncbi:hypothetical protein K7432_017697, partial [Basidiobolus ranarum]